MADVCVLLSDRRGECVLIVFWKCSSECVWDMKRVCMCSRYVGRLVREGGVYSRLRSIYSMWRSDVR